MTGSEILSQIERGLDGVTARTDAPEWIAVEQDGCGIHGGFWTCAAATSESPKYIRADLVREIVRERDEARSQSIGDWSNQRENDLLTIKFYEMKDRATAAEATVTALQEALEQCQNALAMMIEPGDIAQTTVLHAYAAAKEAECRARTALSTIRS